MQHNTLLGRGTPFLGVLKEGGNALAITRHEKRGFISKSGVKGGNDILSVEESYDAEGRKRGGNCLREGGKSRGDG